MTRVRGRSLSYLLLVVACAAPAAPAAALGQAAAPAAAPAAAVPAPSEFRQLKMTAPPSAAAVIVNAKKSGAIGNNGDFTKHYQAVIADFTIPENWGTLATKRIKILKSDLRTYGNLPNSQAHEELTKLLLDTLSKTVADSTYHPGVRLNWALVLGDLNSKEAPLAGAGTAVPHAAVVPILLGLVEDPAQHDAVRAAALIGLVRHAENNKAAHLDDKVKAQFVKDLKDLIQAPAPKERDPAVHQWLQDRARAALGLLGEQAPAATAAPAGAPPAAPSDEPPADAPPADAPPADTPPAAPPADVPPVDEPPGI